MYLDFIMKLFLCNIRIVDIIFCVFYAKHQNHHMPKSY